MSFKVDMYFLFYNMHLSVFAKTDSAYIVHFFGSIFWDLQWIILSVIFRQQ